MKVVVYEPDYNEKHRKVLRAFAEGIPGAVVRPVTEYEPCDVAVIFGGVKKVFPPTHSKRTILDKHQGRSLLMVESAFINRGIYYQVGWGGAAGHADFNTKPDMPLDRWYALKAPARLPFVKSSSQPIIVCGQLPRDVQVQDVDHKKWCRNVVNHYVSRGQKVWFRPHPKIDSVGEYGVPFEYVDNRPLPDALNVARCFVTWNSTSGVDAAVAGVPVVAMDRGSISWDIASHDLDDVDFLPHHDTFAQWCAKIGYAQWTLDEMREGLTWKHLSS